jgi:hypothetical protein
VSTERKIEAWDAKRIADLKNENGFLNLAGLYWLEKGPTVSAATHPTNLFFQRIK